jgi:hypothetical protein
MASEAVQCPESAKSRCDLVRPSAEAGANPISIDVVWLFQEGYVAQKIDRVFKRANFYNRPGS